MSVALINRLLRVKFKAGQVVGPIVFTCACVGLMAYSKASAIVAILLQSAFLYANVQHIRFFGNPINASQVRHLWEERAKAREYSVIVGESLLTLSRARDGWWLLGLAVLCSLVWASPQQVAGLVWLSACVCFIAVSYLLYLFKNQQLSSALFLFFELLRPKSKKAAYFDRSRLPANQSNSQDKWFGALRGKNLILLQLESFQEFVIGHKVNGVEVTPFLNKLLKSGLNFPNIYSQFGMGHTADVELAVLQSIYPQNDEVANYRHFDKHYKGMPSILKELGYATAAFHGFSGDGYNRRTMFKNFGFDNFFAREDLLSSEVIGYGISDVSFFKQVAEKLSSLPKPFFGFAITLTSHYPYVLPGDEKRLDLSGLSSELSDYLQCVNYTDRALEIFWQELKKRGLLENTVVALYGDHEGVINKDIPELFKHLSMEIVDEQIAFAAAKIAKIPFLITAEGWEPDSEYLSSIIGSAMDIGQTMLHLLGTQPIEYGFGIDLFNAPIDRVIPLSAHLPGSYATSKEILLVTGAGNDFRLDLSSGVFIRSDECSEERRKLAEERILAAREALHGNALLIDADIKEKTALFSPHIENFLNGTLFEKNAIIIPFTPIIERNHIHALKENPQDIKKLIKDFSQHQLLDVKFWNYFDINDNSKPVYFASSEYIHYFRGCGYDVRVIAGTRINHYLDALPHHCFIVVACCDDGADEFSEDIAREMSAYGFNKLVKAAYRHSYINLLYKNNGYTSLMEEVKAVEIEKSFEFGAVVRGIATPFSLRVTSAGALAGSPVAEIFVDGVNYSENLRGLNLVAIDMDSAEVISTIRIDSCQTIFDDTAIYLATRKAGRNK